MKTLISNTYALKWQYKDAPHYCVSLCKKIINTRTNKVLKRCLNGGSIGYWIKGSWVAEKNVNRLLEIIEEVDCPF
jgi:hypothetical protein